MVLVKWGFPAPTIFSEKLSAIWSEVFTKLWQHGRGLKTLNNRIYMGRQIIRLPEEGPDRAGPVQALRYYIIQITLNINV